MNNRKPRLYLRLLIGFQRLYLRLLIGFQQLDRRIIYLVVMLFLLMPLLFPFQLPDDISPEVEKFYQTVAKTPKDKPVMVGLDWGAGTQGENWPQTEAALEQFFREGRKVIFIAIVDQGPEFAERITGRLTKKHKLEYGVHYVNLGYKAVTNETVASTFNTFAEDFRAIFSRDFRGTPIDQLPLMKNVRSIRDIGLIAQFTGSASIDYYVQYLSKYVPLVHGGTGIVGPEQYPRLRAGQIKGLLVGMAGAAQYEKKLGIVERGTRAMISISLGHLLIIILIILGNLSMLATRGTAQKGAR